MGTVWVKWRNSTRTHQAVQALERECAWGSPVRSCADGLKMRRAPGQIQEPRADRKFPIQLAAIITDW